MLEMERCFHCMSSVPRSYCTCIFSKIEALDRGQPHLRACFYDTTIPLVCAASASGTGCPLTAVLVHEARGDALPAVGAAPETSHMRAISRLLEVTRCYGPPSLVVITLSPNIPTCGGNCHWYYCVSVRIGVFRSCVLCCLSFCGQKYSTFIIYRRFSSLFQLTSYTIIFLISCVPYSVSNRCFLSLSCPIQMTTVLLYLLSSLLSLFNSFHQTMSCEYLRNVPTIKFPFLLGLFLLELLSSHCVLVI